MSVPFSHIRASFPILSRRINDRPLMYLDSAATSLTPEQVLTAELSFYRNTRANVHRGRHALSEESSAAFEAARFEIARFLGARSHEVVFTANATAALNMVADLLPLPEDSEVLTLSIDHHATILPWRKRWSVKSILTSPLGPVDLQHVQQAIGTRTRLLVVSHASNVSGVVQPVAELCRIAREHGILSVVDAAQSAPHCLVDVEAMGCDFLALSGHKMLGPTGIGVLFGRSEALALLQPSALGGGVVDRVTDSSFELRAPPGCFEAGTPHLAGALGLAAAAQFLAGLGRNQVLEHGCMLASAMRERLASLPGVRAIASQEKLAVPIVSLAFPGMPMDADAMALALSDQHGIMTRAGLLCAHPLFAQLGLPSGALRVSAYVYNTLQEIDELAERLGRLLWSFQ